MAVEDADAARRLEEDAFLSLHKRRVVDFAYANTLIHSADYSWFRVLRRANFTYRWDAAAMRRYRMAAAVLDPASTRYLMHHYESRMNPSQSPVEIFEYERDTARIQDAKRRALRCAGMYCGATRDWADEPVISPTTLDYSASNPGQVDLMKSLDTARLYLYANSSSRGFFGPLLSYISRSSASNFYNYCLSEDGTEALAQAPAAVNYRAAGLLERFALVADPVRRAAALRQAKGQLDQARRKYYEELERLRTRDDLSFGKRDNLLFMIAQTSQRIASVEQKTTAAARETVVDANV
jgi:hypothetical protein